jgi:hypothetical protein
MTYSVFAVDANALSPSGCSAYTYTLNGFLPYLRAPWFQFSEQAVDNTALNGDTNPAFPFLTGHGGANQVVPFGFLGIRTDQSVLYINPSLPPQLSHVKVRTFYYAGATLSATLNSTHTILTRLLTPESANLVDLYANTSLPFIVGTPNSASSPSTSYTLAINSTVTIPNRLYWQTLTYAGNLLQCLSVTSPDPYAPGQFPIAAIDGATATRWQPASNDSASLTVNTSSIPATPISGLYFDWGQRPPINASVYIGNSTDPSGGIYGNEIVINLSSISPSLPYNATAAAASLDTVVPVTSNTTSISISGGAWSGDYIRLVISGCWEDDGEGATVGEFVLIGGSPSSNSSSSTTSSAGSTVTAQTTSVASATATVTSTATSSGKGSGSTTSSTSTSSPTTTPKSSATSTGRNAMLGAVLGLGAIIVLLN